MNEIHWAARFVGVNATVEIVSGALSAAGLAAFIAQARAQIVIGAEQLPLQPRRHDKCNGQGGYSGALAMRYAGTAATADILNEGYTVAQLDALAMGALADAGDGVRLEIAADVSPASALFGFDLISN